MHDVDPFAWKRPDESLPLRGYLSLVRKTGFPTDIYYSAILSGAEMIVECVSSVHLQIGKPLQQSTDA
ncbi:hypothetical protein BOX24_03100 [Leptospirillum ferriphilum]|uniref:Uncharacterized protein n=1 Tax=Leptospirillum ferriphilum TaxID=178606 RepID=A0A1V3SYL1_9BACT|nr:hypothetical protein BOX24_03100 [Leptospirillum ferriphilum]